MKKKKILFAAVDIGYRIEHYTKFIEKNYADKLIAESFSKYVLPKEHYKTAYTYTCPIDKTHPIKLYIYSFCFFIYALLKYDIFHFISGETILTRKLMKIEFILYKIFNKKIIMHFVGADIRNSEYVIWKNNHLEDYLQGNTEKSPPITTKWQNKLIDNVKKYASHIIVSTPDLLEIIPEALYYPVVIDLEKFEVELNACQTKREKNSIKILHTPSNSVLKGSVTIESSLYNLKNKLNNKNIEVVLPGKDRWDIVYSVTRYDLIKHLKESDILIDQLTIGWYGLQTVEGLIAGNEVFCYINTDLEKYIYPNCPIINVNALNIEETLNDYINKKLSINHSHQSKIDWVKKYHTIENNNQTLLQAWGIA